MSTPPFYITTPIYYVNDAPHIGHAYSTVVADVINRYHKLFGEKTFFLTGTDEHGQKVQAAANARHMDPQAHCDEVVVRFQTAWKELSIEPSFFIRTTMDFHKRCVQHCLQQLFEKGEIYASEYEGWYSVSEEIFYTERDLVDGKSPAGKEVTKVKEKNYFFTMSKYQDALIRYIEQHPEFIQPAGKRSEVVGFLKSPLEDLCISRPKSRLSWGIEIPFDHEYVTYVWFDALVNYISALGVFGEKERPNLFETFWPQAIHLIGKDILTTHAVYWPTMLMALQLPLPKTIFAHGWWLTDTGSKMSKSEGPVVTPLDMKDIVGVDAFRYFLVRDIHLGNDAKFSKDLVVSRINSDLANNLGNLASRSINLVKKFFDGKIPPSTNSNPETKVLIQHASEVAEKVREQITALSPNIAIEQVMLLLTATNKYLETLAPWKVAKEDLVLAGESLYASLEVLRIAAILLSPAMPAKMATLLKAIGWNVEPTFDDASKWGLLKSDTPVELGEILFPRIV